MSEINEFEIDFDEMIHDKKQSSDCVKVNVVKLDHNSCASNKNDNDPNIKNIIIDNTNNENNKNNSSNVLNNDNDNLEEINLNCDNDLKSIDFDSLNQSNQSDNSINKEINLEDLSTSIPNKTNESLTNNDDLQSINLDDLSISIPNKKDESSTNNDDLQSINLDDILEDKSLKTADSDKSIDNETNIESNLDELDTLFALKDNEQESLGKIEVDSNNEDMNLDSNTLEDISKDMSGGGDNFEYDSDDSTDSTDTNESINIEENNEVLKGGSKKYKLPIEFDKIDGIYKKTKEYLENRNSKEYIDYLERLETYYQEQKQKKNLEKFSYYVDETGNYIKTQDKKNILKIIPPKYEKTQNIIDYLHNNLEFLESKIKVLRNKTILEPTKENKDEFESMKNEYIKIVNQHNIFRDYHIIINNVKNNINSIKVLTAQKFNLRKELKSLFVEIKELSKDKNKNKSVLDKKIKDYLNKNKVNDIDSKIKDIKNLPTIDYVILEKPKIISEEKTNKLVKKTGKKILKSSKPSKIVKKSSKKKKVINTKADKGPKAEEEAIVEGGKNEDKEEEGKEEVKEDVKEEVKEDVKESEDKVEDELNLDQLNLDELNLDESEEKQSGGGVEIDNKLDNLLEAEDLDLSDDLESIEPEYFEAKPKKKRNKEETKPILSEEVQDNEDTNINLDLSDVNEINKESDVEDLTNLLEGNNNIEVETINLEN